MASSHEQVLVGGASPDHRGPFDRQDASPPAVSAASVTTDTSDGAAQPRRVNFPPDPYVDGTTPPGVPAVVASDRNKHKSSQQLLLQTLLRQRERVLAKLKDLPTHRAARIFPVVHSGQVALLQALLQNEIVSVHERDYNGCTPLHVAAHAGSDEMVIVLLSYGADVAALDNQGRTPLDLAHANSHTYVSRVLLRAAKDAQAQRASTCDGTPAGPPRVPETPPPRSSPAAQAVDVQNGEGEFTSDPTPLMRGQPPPPPTNLGQPMISTPTSSGLPPPHPSSSSAPRPVPMLGMHARSGSHMSVGSSGGPSPGLAPVAFASQASTNWIEAPTSPHMAEQRRHQRTASDSHGAIDPYTSPGMAAAHRPPEMMQRRRSSSGPAGGTGSSGGLSQSSLPPLRDSVAQAPPAEQDEHKPKVATERLASVFTTLSDSVSVIVCMVGLPGRGKSFISKHVCRYLNWKGVPCRVFNAGDYRRQLLGAEGTAGDEFYDPNNQRSKELREQMAELASQDAANFVTEAHVTAVAVLDATNTTMARRKKLVAFFERTAPNARLLFIESVCTRQDVIRENILRAKFGNQDFAGVEDPQQVLDSFYKRIGQYEKVYETLNEVLEPDLAYIRILNVKETVQLHNVSGIIPTRIAYFLLNLHPVAFPIYVCRHGETVSDTRGVFGSDNELTAEGTRFATALAAFALDRASAGAPKLTVLYAAGNEASAATVAPLQRELAKEEFRGANIEIVPETRCLQDVNYGSFFGLTRQHANRLYPRMFERLFTRMSFAAAARNPRGAQPLIAPAPANADTSRAKVIIDATLSTVVTTITDAPEPTPMSAVGGLTGSAKPSPMPGGTISGASATPLAPKMGAPAFPASAMPPSGPKFGASLGPAQLVETDTAASVPMASPMPNAMTMSPTTTTATGTGPLAGVPPETAVAPPRLVSLEEAREQVPGTAFESHKYPAYNVGFPRGESTRQVVVRLEDVLMTAVRCDGPVLIVCPDTPARGVLAYLCDLAPEQTQYVRLPHHAVVEVGTKGDVTISALAELCSAGVTDCAAEHSHPAMTTADT